MTTAVKQRPKHLDLTAIRQPLPAIVSILHRISGALLFLFLIPFGLAALQGSLESSASFAYWAGLVANPLVKLIVLVFVWSYLHHFCAGIRFLLLDVHTGIDLESARFSSMLVLAASLILTLLVAIKLW